MSKRQHIPIMIDMYPLRVHVFLNYTEKDKNKILKQIIKFQKKDLITKKGTERFKTGIKEAIDSVDFIDSCGWMTNYRGTSLIFVHQFDVKKDLINSLDTLVHEIVHVTAHSGRYICMPLAESSEEFYTYLTGFIMKSVLEKVIKK